MTALSGGAYRDPIGQPVTAQPRGSRVAAAPGAPPPRPQPARRLLVAVLAGAVSDLLDERTRDRRSGAELRILAREWISGAPAVVSFAECCQALDIDADAARTALLDRNHPDRAALLFEIGVAVSAA